MQHGFLFCGQTPHAHERTRAHTSTPARTSAGSRRRARAAAEAPGRAASSNHDNTARTLSHTQQAHAAQRTERAARTNCDTHSTRAFSEGCLLVHSQKGSMVVSRERAREQAAHEGAEQIRAHRGEVWSGRGNGRSGNTGKCTTHKKTFLIGRRMVQVMFFFRLVRGLKNCYGSAMRFFYLVEKANQKKKCTQTPAFLA